MEVAAPEKFAASAVNSQCGEASVGQTGGVWDYFDALACHCTGVQNQTSIKDLFFFFLIGLLTKKITPK